MADDRSSADADPAAEQQVGGDESDLSLDALSAAYAGLVEGSPAAAAADDDGPGQPPDGAGDDDPDDLDAAADESQRVTPRGILEAMLFLGDERGEPLTARQVAALMRGVSPREIDELVGELNAAYDRHGCPYTIVSRGAGYVLQLREEFAGLRDRFYGRVREARLSQAAIDVLAIVAYRQPMTREEIDRLRGRPSGGVLSQLVRRQLLRIERPETKPRRPRYYTTDRFLQLMGMEGLGELPQSQELDKSF